MTDLAAPAQTADDDPLSVVSPLVLQEAALLDAEDWDGWLAMLGEDYRYWVPLEPTAGSPEDAPSLIDEDRLLVTMRVRRYAHTRAWGRERGRSTLHQVGGIRARRDGDVIEAEAQQVVHEFHADRLTVYPGHLRLRYAPAGDGWEIIWREVRLINMTGVFDPIEIIL